MSQFWSQKHILSGLVYMKRIKIKILEDLHKKLVSVCKEIQVHFTDNRNICGFNLFKDGLHLLNSSVIFNFNNFLSVIHRPNLFP